MSRSTDRDADLARARDPELPDVDRAMAATGVLEADGEPITPSRVAAVAGWSHHRAFRAMHRARELGWLARRPDLRPPV